MKSLIMMFCILILSIPFNVWAHDAWIEKKGDNFVVLYGHGDKVDPYDPGKVKEVKAYDKAGKEIAVEVKRREKDAVILPKTEPAMIIVFFDSGYWLKTTDGWKNISKKEASGLQIVEPARHSLKYGKTIFNWHEIFTKSVGMRFEIVPMKNPLAIKAGERLPIKVFFEGKPLEGASIDAGGYHKETTKTDKEGIANVTIEKSGKQIIVASYKIPLKDNQDADFLSISANMTFEIK